MGVISTYGELKAAITDYYPRGGLAAFQANLPTFVRRAHDVIAQRLRTPLMQRTADLTIDAERVALPEDFRAVARLFIDGDPDRPLSPTTIETRMVQAARHDVGRPRLYAIEGGDAGPMIAFAPRPGPTLTGRMLYYRAFPFFAADGDTNLVLTRHPFLYLYGSLAEAYRFDQFEEQSATHEALFQRLLAEIDASERSDAGMGGVMIPNPGGIIV